MVRASIQKYPNYYVDVPIFVRICGGEILLPADSNPIDLSNMIEAALSSGTQYHSTKVVDMFTNNMIGKCDISKYALYGDVIRNT